MFRKWWSTLIQGILLFILGLFILKNPVEVLAGISIWFGILILLTGAAGFFGWLFAGRDNRDTGTLLWSLFTVLFGILAMSHIPFVMKAVTIVVGVWVAVSGLSLLTSGWNVKKDTFFGWVLIVVGILSVIAGIYMMLNISSGAEGIAVILGFQVLLTGAAMIILAFVKKMIAGKIKDSVESLKNKF